MSVGAPLSYISAITLAVFFQRYFVSGLTMRTVKVQSHEILQ
jgi:ABC-type glycerol-3-phosphate transport system permease component